MEVLRFIWRGRYKVTVFTRRAVPQRALFIWKAVRRDRFLFGKQFKEIAFCSKDASIKWMVSTAERQKIATLTQRAVAERTISIQRTVVEEHGFNTGDGGKRAVPIRGAVVKRAVPIRGAVVKRAVVKRAVPIREAVVERTVPEYGGRWWRGRFQ